MILYIKNYNNKPLETWYWCEHVHVRLTSKVNVQRHAKTNESYTDFFKCLYIDNLYRSFSNPWKLGKHVYVSKPFKTTCIHTLICYKSWFMY